MIHQLPKYYIEEIVKGNIPVLSKAITLIESNLPKHFEKAQEIIKGCLPYSGKSLRIGITGVPGAGKSTFIEAFGKLLTEEGKKVAILTVDPSSSLSKGSILGDKTRMETLIQNTNVFIRPSASGNHLGGVSQKTRESIVLCEAAGFDVILIETVGVGQSEIEVHSMVDFFLLIQIAGAGDELQGIKRGILEMCDAIVINKADGENISSAKIAQITFENTLHLFSEKRNLWSPKVLICSALKNTGIREVWELIQIFEKKTKENHFFELKRKEQEEKWFYDILKLEIENRFYKNHNIEKHLKEQIELIKQKKTTPYEAVSFLTSFID